MDHFRDRFGYHHFLGRNGLIEKSYTVDFNGQAFDPIYWSNYLQPRWIDIVRQCVRQDAILVIKNFKSSMVGV